MNLAYIEFGIAGSVLGLALLELYNLRRLRKKREQEPPAASQAAKKETDPNGGS